MDPCTASGSDVSGWVRQCDGVQCVQGTRSFVSDNTLDQLLGGPFPGGKGCFGQRLSITIKKRHYASFHFNSGPEGNGLSLQANGSFGYPGMVSVSTVPGDFFGGTALNPGFTGSSVSMSAKPGTHAFFKLHPNTDYYLNVSGMAYPPPHSPTWPDEDQSTYGWTPYLYST